ncbi:MAG: hypothetical protein K6B14_06130 [Lachnospiraceae bacterium]|nr:hypothetical protein [Lachnospiraceae bacterium]
MKKFKPVVQKIPLVIMVTLIMIILSVIGFMEKDDSYVNLNYDVVKKPAVSLVFQGIHDGIYPWSKVEDPTETMVADSGDDGEDMEAEVAEETAEAGDITVEETPEEVGNTTGVADISSGYSYVTVHDEAVESGKTPDEIVEARKFLSRGTFVYAEKIPDGVNSEIVPAKDYGVMDMAFLDPEGTKYKPAHKTIFKKNREFYLQTKAEDDSYFDDALFVGDSRTAGLADYGKLTSHASYFATESLTVYDIMEVKLNLRTPDGEEGAATLQDVLKNHSYKKVYFCIGINELGNVGTLKFYNKYTEVIQTIRDLQPNAVIYVQGIMHENKKMSSSDPVFNNKNVLEKNKAIATLANGHDIFYLDMNEAVCDEDGNLKDEYTNDGIHLKAADYVLWEDWLRDHVIYPAY